MSAELSRTFDVTIVSAYGRGELLAMELKTRGFDVALVDVSQNLGEREPADLEGPFPLVRPTPLLPSHLEWLMTHSFAEVPQGLCIWQKNGPLEMRGPLATFYSEEYPAVEWFRDYFASWLQQGYRRSDLTKKVEPLDFEQSWLIQFAHSLSSNRFMPSVIAHRYSEPFPLNQAVQNARFPAESLVKLQENCTNADIEVFRSDGISDIQISAGKLSDIELILGRKEVLRSNSWVWTLSAEETAQMSRPVANKLYPRGIPEAGWAWRRFQTHTAQVEWDQKFPPVMVLMEDPFLPWSHENVVIFKRQKPGQWDLWLRLPISTSRKLDSLKKVCERLTEILQSRVPHLQVEIEYPWDEKPPLFPVFENETLKSLALPLVNNLVFEGAEALPRLDWAGRYQKQVETLAQLEEMRNQLRAQAPGGQSDQAIHAP